MIENTAMSTSEFVTSIMDSLSGIDLATADPVVADIVEQIYLLCETLSLLAF